MDDETVRTSYSPDVVQKILLNMKKGVSEKGVRKRCQELFLAKSFESGYLEDQALNWLFILEDAGVPRPRFSVDQY